MFKSFFPNPKLFFLSALVWASVCVAVWFIFNDNLNQFFNIDTSNKEPIVGLGHFYNPSFLLFTSYYFISIIIFALFWFKFSPHKWQNWSILGSGFILFSTYFSVQVSLAINTWRRPFGDTLQNALAPESGIKVTEGDFYSLMLIFAQIAFLSLFVYVLTRFFVSHYVFRWRTAMNDYYTSQWKKLRKVEGASQRIQEDTMIFARIVEGLGVSFVDAIMTLFAFLPLLWGLSSNVTTLPIVGEIPAPLMTAIIFWSVFGTVLLAVVGIKLPGLEFKNQRVEAAYRKELVYGEDHEDRADPLTLKELYQNLQKNYFRLYFHYLYFNIARSLYLQADNLFAYFILIPTIIAAKITYGLLSQIVSAFTQVSSSFHYLINSWPTIVELLSVHKRLKAFEATLNNEELPEIETELQA